MRDSGNKNNIKMLNWQPLIKSLNTVIGLLVMTVLANLWSNHLQQLHENDMWFSNIEVCFSIFGDLFRNIKKQLGINLLTTAIK